jgi:hypothetical protein
MVNSTGVLECPYCQEVFEVQSSDSIRTAFSTAKPIPKIYYGEFKVKRHRCKNPECRKTVTVYWYSPLEYFSRI